MVLDLYFELIEKFTFPSSQMAKFGAYSSSISYPLCSSCLALSIIVYSTNIHVKDKEM
jgi:hypothetical protein